MLFVIDHIYKNTNLEIVRSKLTMRVWFQCKPMSMNVSLKMMCLVKRAHDFYEYILEIWSI